jgi:hypothetical protein
MSRILAVVVLSVLVVVGVAFADGDGGSEAVPELPGVLADIR